MCPVEPRPLLNMCPCVTQGREMYFNEATSFGEADDRWRKCWMELESIEYPDEWSQGEASTPSRTPSPELIIRDKMVGGKLWMKVPQLVLIILHISYEEGPPPHLTSPPYAEARKFVDAIDIKYTVRTIV